MNDNVRALRQAGYETYAHETGVAQLFIDANRWWIDEERGVFRLEPSGEPYYAIAVMVSPDGTIQLCDGMDGDPLMIDPIRFSQPGQLPDIIRNLQKAFCDETTLDEGTEIIRSMLT